MPSPYVTRQHGTRACYMFGVTGSDLRNGCRCAPCTAANTAYQLDRRHGDAWIDSTHALEHVLWLSSKGIGYRAIAAAIDVNPSTIQRLADGRRVRKSIAAKILALHALSPAFLDRTWVPAGETWRYIDALHARGWTYKRIAQALGPNPNARVLQIGRQRVTRSTAAKVEALVKAAAPDAWAAVRDDLAAARVRHDQAADAAARRRERDRLRKRQRSAAA